MATQTLRASAPPPLCHMGLTCEAIDSVCDDRGELGCALDGAAARRLAVRLTHLLGGASRREWWTDSEAGRGPMGTVVPGTPAFPPPECCECVCLMRIAGDLALRERPPFAAEPRGGDAGLDVSSAAPAPSIDVLAATLKALELMATWQPPAMPTETKARAASSGRDRKRSGLVETLSLEREAIRLIAYLSHQRPACQNRVRELGGLITVLQRCQLDDRNPMIREWAVLAIRNLTEDCAENQEFIASIEQQPQGVANPDLLDDAGLEVAIDRGTGKVKLKRTDEQPARGEASASDVSELA